MRSFKTIITLSHTSPIHIVKPHYRPSGDGESKSFAYESVEIFPTEIYNIHNNILDITTITVH